MQDVGRGLCSVRERGDWEQGLMGESTGTGREWLGEDCSGGCGKKKWRR